MRQVYWHKSKPSNGLGTKQLKSTTGSKKKKKKKKDIFLNTQSNSKWF